MSIFYANSGGGGAPATQAEVDSNAAVNRYVAPDTLRLMRQTNGAFIGGDLTGNARGTNALDFQSARGSATQVASGSRATAFGINNTASDYFSTAVGVNNTASSYYTSAIGYLNTSSGYYSSSIGNSNTSSGGNSSAVGYLNESAGDSSAFGNENISSSINASAFGSRNTAAGDESSAFGFSNRALSGRSSAFGFDNVVSGGGSSAFGHENLVSAGNSAVVGFRVQTTVANTFEAGIWGSVGVDRGGGFRADLSGMTQFSVSFSAPTDGGAVNGSEPLGTLGRGMLSFEVIGGELIAYRNNAGTIQSNNLGAFT